MNLLLTNTNNVVRSFFVNTINHIDNPTHIIDIKNTPIKFKYLLIFTK